ncbi:DoxX family protein [Synoicihabitans lomoniglobus]|uniref:DoxX family protein n=1 Tax=Synoicihabitans lomoniglobus TaxID=2909285 RepID=A0AAE9ZUU9_9BACT|nr:DoxX family protein [Opitutaceae bacterium LMO-M01]WED63464.1 DoxX family protein [Opitutaceae bacterium LMO-M01]
MTADISSLPPWRRVFTHVVRILFGLGCTIFGLNGFLNFIQPPPDLVLSDEAMAFSVALMESGYMMPMIGATLLVPGLLLLANRFVPLALVLLAPFFVNSVAFHLALERTGLPNALVFVAMLLYLAWTYRAAYRPLFVARYSAIKES